MSHWIRRKNSQLNKRRPTARPTHSSGTGTESHTHTHTCMHIYTVRASHLERHVHKHNSYGLPCSHTPHTYQCFSVPRCIPFTLNLSDAAFDKCALPSVIFISSSGFFPPAAALIMLARKSTVSPGSVEINSFFMV